MHYLSIVEYVREWVLTYWWEDMWGAGEGNVWEVDSENERKKKKTQIILLRHWHVWTSWSLQQKTARQGYLSARVGLWRFAGGEAAGSCTWGCACTWWWTWLFQHPSQLGGSDGHGGWRAKDKLRTSPSSPIFRHPITKTQFQLLHLCVNFSLGQL